MSSSDEHEGEGFLNLNLNKQEKLVAQKPAGDENVAVSSRFGWSTHNCHCAKSKTGLIFYPTNIIHKNIVLLVCETCYGYLSGVKTQHQQLADWYYGIYGESKSFSFVSGFSQKENGKLGFNSGSMNCGSTQYHTGDRTMGQLEQEVVRQVVRGQLNSYEISSTSNRQVGKETDYLLKFLLFF